MKKIRFGLRQKITVFCTLFAIILCGSVGYIGYVNYSSNMIRKYQDYAGTLIKFIERKFEDNNIISLLDGEAMDENYESMRHELNQLKESADADYIYSLYFKEKGDIDSMSYVINGVTAQEIAEAGGEEAAYSYLGELCGEDDFDREMKEHFLECIESGNRDVNYYVNNTAEYGYQLTCYKAIFGEGDNALIIAVDISMNEINSNRIQYVRNVSILSVALLVLFLIAFIGITDRSVVKPVMRMEESSRDFVEQTRRIQSPDELQFRPVPSCSKDEIEVLRQSIEDMAEGIRSYMVDLERVTEEKGKITAELDVATNIQLSMLPRIFPAFPEREDFDVYASIATAKEVGGDFYDFYMIGSDRLCVTIADVSGKGVPAALFMVIAKTLLKDHMLLGKEPAQAFMDVNDLLAESNEQDMFVTVWMAVIDLAAMKAKVVNAGHNPPLLKHPDGEFEYCNIKPGFVLGAMEGMPYQETELDLAPGDVFYLYTDGITEANNTAEELYGEDRLQECLNRCGTEDLKSLLEKVKADIDGFVGEAPQFDDMTMVTFKVKGK